MNLILVADDHGTYPANPVILRHNCYPAELGIRVSDISSLLKKLQATGVLAIFEKPSGPVLKIADEIWRMIFSPNSKVGKPKYLAFEQGELPLPKNGETNVTAIWSTCTGTNAESNTSTPAAPPQQKGKSDSLSTVKKHVSSEKKKNTHVPPPPEMPDDPRDTPDFGEEPEINELIKEIGWPDWGTNLDNWRLRIADDKPALLRALRDWKSKTPAEKKDYNPGAWITKTFYIYSPRNSPENRKKKAI